VIFNNLKNNLSAQLLKKVFLFYILIAISLTVVQMVLIFNKTKIDVQNTLKNFKITFAPTLRKAIWDLDEEQTKKLIDGVVSTTSVISIQIVDMKGIKIHEAGVSLDKNNLTEDVFFQEFDMVYNDIYIGKAILYSNTFVVLKKVQNDFIILIINSIIKSLALWFLVLVVAKKLITNPLKKLTDELEGIDLDNMINKNISLNLTEKNELSIVEQAFNKMIKKLKHTYDKLDKLNKNLENKVKSRTKNLEKLNQELEIMANTDPLTGAYNRRYFYSVSKSMVSLVVRDKKDLSVVMIDIDKFKNINDKYGHDVGDIVIKELVVIVLDVIRKSDVLARFGGEEFAIILPNTTIKGAEIVAQKIRTRIEDSIVLNKIKYTVSIGVSKLLENENDIDNILIRADKALFLAKEAGRNKVVTYTGVESPLLN